jgi:uncharacterized protein
MSSVVEKLTKKNLIRPPRFVTPNICYECIMGSVAYGVSSDTSDMDIYGFCIPSKQIIFPHLAGEILGFGRQKKRFEQYQEHHIVDKEGRKEYDLTIYSIIKYFNLCMENNPNMVDSLFVPENCVLTLSYVGDLVRQHRTLFLHKGAYYKFRGYAHSQMHKMRSKNPSDDSKRKELIEKYNYDTKFAYHLYRLIDEVEQILEFGTIDLQRARELLKSVRRGEIPEEEIYKYYAHKEKILENLYEKSTLRKYPDEKAIKDLLIKCLEHHFGSLDKCIMSVAPNEILIREIEEVLGRYK